jgi:hypothetical protein
LDWDGNPIYGIAKAMIALVIEKGWPGMAMMTSRDLPRYLVEESIYPWLMTNWRYYYEVKLTLYYGISFISYRCFVVFGDAQAHSLKDVGARLSGHDNRKRRYKIKETWWFTS